MTRLTREQVRRIDALAAERYHMPGIMLMENAARAAADVAMEMALARGRVLIVCGGGNNGGDGLAVARHLHNRQNDVHILLTGDPAKYKHEAKVNYDIVSAMRLPIADVGTHHWRDRHWGLIVDAIFGTGLIKPPRDPFGEWVGAIEKTGSPVLAIDIPSGMDCDTGLPMGPTIRATRTITFVAEKAGFAEPGASKYLGEVTVGDIGCPKELIEWVRLSDPTK